MEKLNFENLEPNRDGIMVGDRCMVVRGYSIKRGIQTFFDEKEDLTSRVRGVDMPDGNHYLINEDDVEYIKSTCGEYICKTKRIYIVVKYNEKKRVVFGKEISHDQNPKLFDDICKKL